MTADRQRMGDLHEIYLAEVNGGTKSRASGSQWFDQGDGRGTHDAPFAFCWDGKSTLGKQIAVTLDMLAKIREQAQGERPEVGLRFYANEALDKITEDWIAVPGADFGEMKATAESWVMLLRLLGKTGADPAGLAQRILEKEAALKGAVAELENVMAELNVLRPEVASLRLTVAAVEERTEAVTDTAAKVSRNWSALEAERDRYKAIAEAAQEGRLIPPHIPRLPWVVVYQVHFPGHTETSGMSYDHQGHMTPFTVSSIRVERSAGNRPRLMVNDTLVQAGDLYTDGTLRARTWPENASGEVG